MSIRIVINGATGNMGRMTINGLAEKSDFKIVATLGRNDNLAQTLKTSKPDIVIDFTSPEAVWNNSQIIIEHNVHPVIGTTGLSSQQIEILQKRCSQQKLGGIIAPNFSIGAILMMKYAQDAAHYFQHVEIIEAHHPKKLDAPSGTAIKTAAMINQTRAQHVPIHSIRLPGMLAHQTVIFGSEGQTLTLQHDTTDRNSYLPGIIVACKKVMELQELIYGLEHIL